MRSVISSYARRRISPRSRGATCAERAERLVGGGQRRLAVGDRRVGDLDERLAGRRVLDGQRPAAGPVAPLAADEELRRDRVEHGPLGARADRRHGPSIPPANGPCPTGASGACGRVVRLPWEGCAASLAIASPPRPLLRARRRAAQGATSLVATVRGFGHGVGLSQYGTLGFAQHGWTADRILAHYYTGTQLGRLTSRRGAGAAAERPLAATRSAAPRRSAGSSSTRRRRTPSSRGRDGLVAARRGGQRPLHLDRPDAACARPPAAL